MDMCSCMWRNGNFSTVSFSFFLILSHKSSFQWLAFRELVPLCPQRPSFLEHYIDSAVLIAVMDQGQVHKSRFQKWPVGKLNGFSFKWLLDVSFNKWMLCSRCPFELGPIVSVLWGTYWKCPSQDLWGWGWWITVFTLCCRVFAWNQPDWSSKRRPRTAVSFPASLCSSEKQKEAEISRDALAGTFAIPLSSRAAQKILVRVWCLTSSFTCSGIDTWGLSIHLCFCFL